MQIIHPLLITVILDHLIEDCYQELLKIYLRDLLNPSNWKKLKIKESRNEIYIESLLEMYVRDGQEVIDLLSMGSGNRSCAATMMSAVSTRSHGKFTLRLQQNNTTNEDIKESIIRFYDLAQSYKLSKTNAQCSLLE